MSMYTLQAVAAAAAESGEDLGGFMSPQRLEIAGQVVLIGMGMVFAVLALLWGILACFGKIMASRDQKKKTPPVESAVVEVPSEEVSGEATSAEDEGELVAAITAAVAAAIASDAALSSRFASGFRVVSYKKSGH